MIYLSIYPSIGPSNLLHTQETLISRYHHSGWVSTRVFLVTNSKDGSLQGLLQAGEGVSYFHGLGWRISFTEGIGTIVVVSDKSMADMRRNSTPSKMSLDTECVIAWEFLTFL
jgi:hypothetical protein